jgi:hypothetical protein
MATGLIQYGLQQEVDWIVRRPIQSIRHYIAANADTMRIEYSVTHQTTDAFPDTTHQLSNQRQISVSIAQKRP